MTTDNLQYTLKEPVTITGIGLHTGKNVTMTFNPAQENTGIVFCRTDLEGNPTIKACLNNVIGTNRGTVIKENEASVHTVEHVLSALQGYGITNVKVDLSNEEPPVCDGSAFVYLDALKKAERVAQAEGLAPYRFKQIFSLVEGEKSMIYLPSNKFEVTFRLEYNNDIVPGQTIHLVIDEDEYGTRVARARTFGFEYEFEMLEKNNLALGGSLDNAIVINNDGKVRNPEGLRDEEELILHKILDLIGDFALLGRKVKGHIIANKTGHYFNVKFARLIEQKFCQSKGRREKNEMMYIEDIKKVLPHRYPFLLVDRILSVEPGKSIVGIKNVTANEEFFNGHFPGQPVMPGVLQVEAMAQVAGVLFLSQPENKGKTPFFCGIDKVRFRKPVVPGDQLEFHIKVLKVRRNTGKVEAQAKVDGELVAGGELMFQLV
jgi:UDP-3-O-[3-hydroxymyristoyl] N-acetylglucosamine deacetylase/3-hydroxyacyl-[acyl-carrier-protein] dehydratase